MDQNPQELLVKDMEMVPNPQEIEEVVKEMVLNHLAIMVLNLQDMVMGKVTQEMDEEMAEVMVPEMETVMVMEGVTVKVHTTLEIITITLVQEDPVKIIDRMVRIELYLKF